MKTINLDEAIGILENCAAVVWNDNFLCYPSISDVDGEDENQFLYISADDYSCKFTEGMNRNVKIVGSSMFLIDDEGDEVQLTILIPQTLE